MEIKGQKVYDANKPLKINISKRDVQLGGVKNPKTCAAARALCRQKDVTEAAVHLSRTYVKRAGKWERYVTPLALRSEIIAFDRGGEFDPGDYTLASPHPHIRLGSKRKPTRTGTHPQRGSRIKPHIVSGVRVHAPK